MREGGSGRKSRAIIAGEARVELEKGLAILGQIGVTMEDAEEWDRAGGLLRQAGRLFVQAGRLSRRVGWRLGYRPVIVADEESE